MRSSKFYLFLVFSITFQVVSYGQSSIPKIDKLQTPKEYYLQVKQFSEFIDRFNYKTDWKGNLITEEFAQKVPHNSYLFYLINQEDQRLTDPNDSSYRVICGEFIAFITNPQHQREISLYSGQVKANALVNIVCFGKDAQIKVEMIPDVLSDRSARWVINGVESSLFASNADSIKKHFIAPNSHETSFINLKKLNETDNAIYYLSPSTANAMVFIKGLEQKKILIKSIEKVIYTITFPDWIITVEEFNRTANNSGWLISNIQKL
jgi:hypothetical protein